MAHDSTGNGPHNPCSRGDTCPGPLTAASQPGLRAHPRGSRHLCLHCLVHIPLVQHTEMTFHRRLSPTVANNSKLKPSHRRAKEQGLQMPPPPPQLPLHHLPPGSTSRAQLAAGSVCQRPPHRAAALRGSGHRSAARPSFPALERFLRDLDKLVLPALRCASCWKSEHPGSKSRHALKVKLFIVILK